MTLDLFDSRVLVCQARQAAKIRSRLLQARESDTRAQAIAFSGKGCRYV
jgi:hypothetical protein